MEEDIIRAPGQQLEKPLILHVRASNFFGGPEKQILGHITSSGNWRHCVVTYIESGSPNEFLDRCRAANVQVETLETWHPFAPRVIRDLRMLLRRLKPAIVCSHGYKPAVLCTAARVGMHIPLITFARGHTNETLKIKFFEFLERLCFRRADIVVAVSQGYADWLIKSGIPPNKIRVVHNAVDSCEYSPDPKRILDKRLELSHSKDVIILATAGRLSPEKGHADLIRSFPQVRSRFPNVRLLVIGDGPLRRKLEGMVRKLSVDGIEFLGFRRDLKDILPAIDLFVLPSLSEGLPNVVLEAYAAGKPVVAASVGGVPDLVEDGLNGILVPPGQPRLLADAIVRCAADPSLRETLGKAGRTMVKSRFTFEGQTQRLESIYAQILDAESPTQ